MPIKKGFIRGPQSDEHKAKISAANKGKPRSPSSGRPANTAEILWSKVGRGHSDECWPWLGFRNEQGYGRTWINGKGYYAHRVIFDLMNPGAITLSAPRRTDEPGFVRHSCDNPPCCNPKHMLLGTHGDNMADKVARGRLPNFKGHRGPRAKLTQEEAIEVRRIAGYGISKRELALLFGISKPSAQSIAVGRTYRE